MRTKVLVSWSGGKDCALALHAVRESGPYDVVSLLTTVSEDSNRVSMHGVRRELLRQQAESLGLPLQEIPIAPSDGYEATMRTILGRFKEEGVSQVVIGDIFLEDLRRYREEKLALIGLEGLFPLWGKDTTDLAHAFLEQGFKAVITCVDTDLLEPRFVGRRYDAALLRELPPGVDPCGENGEFHSFVYAGPGFRHEIPFTVGVLLPEEDHFQWCDLVPADKH